MKRAGTTPFFVALIGGSILLVFWQARSAAPAPSGLHLPDIAFTEVNIVDIESGTVLENQTILLKDGVIETIGPGENLTIPAGTHVEPKPGLYATPGFWDMHVHFDRLQEHYAGPMLVMFGVFYVRNLSGDCIGSVCKDGRPIFESRAIQSRVSRDELLAPQFVQLSSYIIRGPGEAFRSSLAYPATPSFLVPTTMAQGRCVAAFADERGADFLKVYNSVSEEALTGMILEAGKRGMYVGGHVPRSVTLERALSLGMHTIEHARALPLACSDVSERFAEDYRTWATSSHQDSPEPELHEYYASILAQPNRELCAAVLKKWADSGAYYVPTHQTRLAEAILHTRPYRTDSRSVYVPYHQIHSDWEREANDYERLFSKDEALANEFAAFYERGVELTGNAHSAGVNLLVGTDAGDSLIYPGPSFHDELNVYSDAGIPNAEILAAATLTAARFAELDRHYGTLSVGKRGDIVFLEANPLLDIGSTSLIDSLYFRKFHYDRTARMAIIDRVRQKSRGLSHRLIVAQGLLDSLPTRRRLSLQAVVDRDCAITSGHDPGSRH